MSDRPFPDPEILAEPVQPEAAMAFWAWKSATPYNEVKKLDDGARERAFYADGLFEHDAVKSVKDALNKALKNGETFRDFQGRIEDIIKAQGWRGDRIETIFRNNLQTAYAAGRYKKMQMVKKARPYWQYITVGDERVRPSHGVLNGMVFPADHEFWEENYTPNGHKCRCAVVTLSARQVAKEDLEVQKKIPRDLLYTDPNTGMEYHVARPGADDGWRSNPAKVWMKGGGKKDSSTPNPSAGLPLKKYPDLTPEAYAEWRLRPKPVKNFEELAAGIRQKCSGYLKNSNGFGKMKEIKSRSAMMSTNGQGSLNIHNYDFKTRNGIFNPSKILQSSWNKLATGKELSWNEEYSIESLWHELTHNRQKWGPLGASQTSLKRRAMEITTQWTARRTYPELLKSMGRKALHLESIKKDGLGYGREIKRFDRILGILKIDEDALLAKMQHIIDTMTMDRYGEELSTWLAKQSGYKRGKIHMAISATGLEKEADFETKLRELGLLQEGKN